MDHWTGMLPAHPYSTQSFRPYVLLDTLAEDLNSAISFHASRNRVIQSSSEAFSESLPDLRRERGPSVQLPQSSLLRGVWLPPMEYPFPFMNSPLDHEVNSTAATPQPTLQHLSPLPQGAIYFPRGRGAGGDGDEKRSAQSAPDDASVELPDRGVQAEIQRDLEPAKGSESQVDAVHRETERNAPLAKKSRLPRGKQTETPNGLLFEVLQ